MRGRTEFQAAPRAVVAGEPARAASTNPLVSSKFAAAGGGRAAITGRGLAILLGAMLLAAAPGHAAQLQTVRFGTDWKAEAEYGGYYEAIATGIYKKHGLT